MVCVALRNVSLRLQNEWADAVGQKAKQTGVRADSSRYKYEAPFTCIFVPPELQSKACLASRG